MGEIKLEERLQELLKTKGFKITVQRKAVLEAFLKLSKHLLTAAEVYDYIQTKSNKFNYSTVYRNLELLTEAGIISRINLDNGINYYELNLEDHHHHLICLSCGIAEKTNFCPMEKIKLTIEESTDFVPIDHKLEIYGYCGRCKKID